MTRPQLMEAIITALGSRKLAAAALGCTPQMISHIRIGKFAMTDDMVKVALAALVDHAERLDRLATLLERELRTSPRVSRWGNYRNMGVTV